MSMETCIIAARPIETDSVNLHSTCVTQTPRSTLSLHARINAVQVCSSPLDYIVGDNILVNLYSTGFQGC
jgi:hypothetical protein